MRPEILYPLFAPASSLKGVGPRLAPLVERVAGQNVRDLLFLSPQSLMARPRATFETAIDGEIQTFSVRIEAHIPPARSGQPYSIRTFDETGFITLNWFRGGGPHLLRAHPIGAMRLVSGKIERYGSILSLAHPDYLLPPERAAEIPLIEPIYPATAGLPSRSLRRFVQESLERVPDVAEWLDPAWIAREGWQSWPNAIRALHSPTCAEDLSPLSPVRRRLAYDELLAHQLTLAQRRLSRRSEPGSVIIRGDLAVSLERALPYQLTGVQHRALAQIRTDLASGERMSRLLHGDVGSGKTVVAMLAMAEVAQSGHQAALMAPTEILARQHVDSLTPAFEAFGMPVMLLTGRDKGRVRDDKLRALASGAVRLVVGTHALVQADVTFTDLALAVIDEQHRFGVAERKRLSDKGPGVHLLAMSATPIPRTLELTLFGDLDVSRLDEKPAGRTPVITRAVPSGRIGSVIARLCQAVDQGSQAFWICPLVSESELIDLQAAVGRAADLRHHLGGRVGLVHGQLPAAEKDAVMAAFVAGTLSVLVATTVVEVGVNVPRATIMVIEQAERFGLAQLHQLRGRVGRGGKQSACVLLYDAPLSKTAEARLDVLRRTDDGFEIAERDLALRGGGDPLGLRQSGLPAYRFVDAVAHGDLIRIAADDARLILSRDPHLESPRGKALRLLLALFDWRPTGLTDAG